MKIIINIITLLALTACSPSNNEPSNESNNTLNKGTENTKPIAIINAPQSILTGGFILLDGRKSNDPDSDQITYIWKFVHKPPASVVTISNTKNDLASFSPDVDGTYIIELIVSDEALDSSPTNITVVASSNNIKPQANAGNNRQGTINALVQLNGTASFDSNNDTLSYLWTIIQKPVGSNVSLLEPNTFHASFVPDASGEYVIELVVNDGLINSDSSKVTITVAEVATAPVNTLPIANGGGNKSGKLGSFFHLDGSNSNDADNDDITFSWTFVSRPNNSDAELLDSNSVNASFTPDIDGIYLIGLVVNDGLADSDQVVIAVVAQANNDPVAGTGDSKSGVSGTLIQLDGSDSSDVDNDDLTYLWSFISRPDGSAAELFNADSINPSFTPDTEGVYLVGLVVNDGLVDSEQSNININIIKSNAPPIANAGIDQTGITGNQIKLDGDNSNDPDDDTLNYTWSFKVALDINNNPINTNGWLDDLHIVKPSFMPTLAGTYLLQLIVNDGSLNSEPNIVKIEISNPPTYRVSIVTVNSLEGSELVLQNNSSDDLVIGALPPYHFSKQLFKGENYVISVKKQPINPSQNCVVDTPTGSVDTQDITITINCQTIDTNTAPSISTDSLVIIENSNMTSEPVKAIDGESNSLTFSIVGGVDASLFSIGSISGELTIRTPPDFERPIDANTDNIFELEIQVDDGVAQSKKIIFIDVSPVNEEPIIVNIDTFDVDENASFVTQLSATDPENVNLDYQLQDTFDKQYFNLNPSNQQLSLINPMDFESPQDENTDNQYNLTLHVSDGINTVTQDLIINIKPINEFSPEFTSIDTYSIFEKETNITTLQANDDDNQTVTFEITTSADQSLFLLDTITGNLAFKNPPDFEKPLDLDNDNIYEIAVQASDGEKYTVLALSIHVDNISAIKSIELKDSSGSIKSARKILIDNSLAYVSTYIADTDTHNLQIIDISQPQVPKFMGNTEVLGPIEDISIVDSIIYIAYNNRTPFSSEGDNGIQIIDVKNPDAPCTLKNLVTPGDLTYEAGTFTWTYPRYVNGITILNGNAYITYSSGQHREGPGISGLQIIDVSSIGDVCNDGIAEEPISISDTRTNARHFGNIVLKNSIAYITSNSPGLILFDVKNPFEPHALGYKAIYTGENPGGTDTYLQSLSILGSTAYVSYFSYNTGDPPAKYGFKIFDLSDIYPFSYTKTSANPIVNAGTFEEIYQSVRGRNAPLKWDIQTPPFLECSTIGCDVHLMFVESYWGHEKGTCIGGERTFSITVEGTLYEDNYDICLLTQAANTAIEYIVSDNIIDDDTLSIKLDLGTTGKDVKPEIAGLYLTNEIGSYYMNIGGESSGSFRAESYRTSGVPTDLGYLAMEDYMTDAKVVGTKAYSVTYAGLQIIDLSNKEIPILIGTINGLMSRVYDVDVLGDYAFVANGDIGLTIVTLSEAEIIPPN